MSVIETFFWFFVILTSTLQESKADDIITNEQLKQRGITHIYMMGDIHGSFQSLLSAAMAVGICDEAAKWQKHNVILIQVGDLIHRGPDSVAVVTTFKRWQQEAPQYNSRVVVLKGNHEDLEAEAHENAGDQETFEWQMQHESYQFGEPSNETYQHFLPGTELGEWIRQLPVIQIIGDSLFVHAGITHEWLSPFRYNITKINRFAATNSFHDRESADAVHRMLSTRQFASECMRLYMPNMWKALDVFNWRFMQLNVRRVVIGHNHTPSEQIEAYYDDARKYSLLSLDTGYVWGNWSVACITVETGKLEWIDQHLNKRVICSDDQREGETDRKRKRVDSQ